MHDLTDLHTNKLSNKLLAITALYIPIVAISLIVRYVKDGWNNLYFNYLTVCSLLLALYFFRTQFTPQFKLHAIATCMIMSGFTGMFFLGLAGAYYMTVAAIIIITLISGFKVGTIISGIFTIYYLFVSYLHTSGHISIDTTLHQYNANVYSWLTNGIALSWLLFMSLASAGRFKTMLTNALVDVLKKQKRTNYLNKKLSQQMEFLPIPILILDFSGKVNYSNVAFRELFGYNSPDLMQESFLEKEFLKTKDNIEHWNEAVEGCFKSIDIKKVMRFEVKNSKGDLKYVSVHFTVIDKDLEICFIDNTLRIISAMRAKQNLKTSEQRFDLAMKGANVGLWDWKIPENEIYYSPTWKKLLGYEDHELENSFEQWIKLLHKDDANFMPQYVNDFISETNSNYDVAFRMMHKTGKVVHILARGHISYDDEGNPLRFTGTHVDVTKQKQVEKELEQHKNQLSDLVAKRTEDLASAITQLQQSNHELANQKETLAATLEHLHRTQDQLIENEKMASLGVLIAGVAHEINNPINFILASIDGMKGLAVSLPKIIRLYENITPDNVRSQLAIIDQMKIDEDFEFKLENFDEALRLINTGTNRIAKIVSSLQTVSRPNGDSFTVIPIEKCIQTTLSLLNHEIKHGITVKTSYKKIPAFRMDENKISQVFMNIIVNAIYAMNGNGILTIETKLNTDKNTVIISIADDGDGIPEDIRSHIFEPFYTTKPVGKGTGLGLFLCYKIITDMGGEMMVNTESGKGSCFYISLPITDAN